MPFLKKTATDLIRIKRPTANHQQTEYTPGVVMFEIGKWLGSRLGMGTGLRNVAKCCRLNHLTRPVNRILNIYKLYSG